MGSLERLILQRFIMAQPAEITAKITLVNPKTIQEVVQLVTRLDGLEMDRMSGARAAAVIRLPPNHPPQCAEDAFHDMGMAGDSVETESDPDHGLDPTDLLVALSHFGGTDFPEVMAAFMDKGQKPSVFTCFFCKDSGHTWLKCSKLWDHLKRNGFTPRSRPKHHTRHKGNASRGPTPVQAGNQNAQTHPN